MLEFSTWERARAWGYLGNFGIEEGLKANDVDCVVLPALQEVPTSSSASWLYHARQFLRDQRFDQVWVWLVHNSYDPAAMEWLRGLAPVVVGWVGESLEHTAEELWRFPHLARRQELAEQQIRQMTHVLAVDERDVDYINQRGLARAIWYPLAVPSRYLVEPAAASIDRRPVFSGSSYGARAEWLEHPALQPVLRRATPPEEGSPHPEMFDRLHRLVNGRSEGLGPLAGELLSDYVDAWRALRRKLFDRWMEVLRQWPAVVNLPSVGKVYTSRVVEAMAVSTPVLSWEIPNRPRNRALFEDGKEILLFPENEPHGLAAQIRRLEHEPGLGQRLASAARLKIGRQHTVERRVQQVLRWIDTGEEPDYSQDSQTDEVEVAFQRFRRHLEEATSSGGPATESVPGSDTTSAPSRRDRMLGYLESAEKAMKLGDSDEAVAIWEAAVRSFPEVVGFRSALAGLLEKIGRADGAAEAYARAIADHPQSLALVLPATRLDLRRGELGGALGHLSRAAGLDLSVSDWGGVAACAREAAARVEERAEGLRDRQAEENRRYHMAEGYASRAAAQAHDDTTFKDEWQDEIYALARKLVDAHGLTSVFDIGCGSGFKLVKYFASSATVGAEVSPTYEFLLHRYPDRRWIRSDFSVPFEEKVDLVIAADVVEHLHDPDALMRFIAAIDCRFVILSTTDRDLLGGGHGPPRNPCHVREWTSGEFRSYVASHFPILEHGISNPQQAAQVVICAGARS